MRKFMIIIIGFCALAFIGTIGADAMKIEKGLATQVCGSDFKSGDGGKNTGCSFCNKLNCYDINCKKGAKKCDATRVESSAPQGGLSIGAEL